MAKERASNALMDLIAGTRRAAPKHDSPALPGMSAARSANSGEAVQHSPRSEREIESGGEQTELAERQESLVERVLSGTVRVSPETARDDLTALHGVLAGLAGKTVIVVFALGKVLMGLKAELPHGEFIPWIETNCAFSRWSAQNYMRVYERYKNYPQRALADLSISEAYVEAGVKRLTLPFPDDAVKRKGSGAGDDDMPSYEEFRRLFQQATMSGVDLKRHRVVPYKDGKLYVVRPELGPLLVCDLYTDMSIPDPGYQDAIQEVHHNLQMALEVFFSKVEVLEEQGILSPPFDSSRPAMARKMRNVSPDTPEKSSATKRSPKAKGGKR